MKTNEIREIAQGIVHLIQDPKNILAPVTLDYLKHAILYFDDTDRRSFAAEILNETRVVVESSQNNS